MTQRRHIDSGVTCGGCRREFGIIQQSHIDRCDGLSRLGIANRAQYKAILGPTMSRSAIAVSSSTISAFNGSLSADERTARAKSAHAAAIAIHPRLYSMGGIAGAASLWAKDGQKQRHVERLVAMNRSGFMQQSPNKLEKKFWDLIGHDRIGFSSFKFWKTVSAVEGYKAITPDFRVNGADAVIEVFGDYWHHGEDPAGRIAEWKSVGLDCLVVWEHEINSDLNGVKQSVSDFISRNLHERGTPAS